MRAPRCLASSRGDSRGVAFAAASSVLAGSVAGCCLGGGHDATPGPTWTLTFEALETAIATDELVHVVLSSFPGVTIVSIDPATGVTQRTTTIDPEAGGAALQRMTDPRGASLAFLEVQGVNVAAVHVFDAQGPRRVAAPAGVTDSAVSLQAGLVVIVSGDEVIALRDDGHEAWRVTVPHAQSPHGVWNESSSTVVVEDGSDHAHALSATDGSPLEDIEIAPGDLRFLTDTLLLRFGRDAVVARVRGSTTEVSLEGARAWVQGEDWIAFLAGDAIMLRRTDLTALGPDVSADCPEHATSTGDLLVLPPRGDQDLVRVLDVRTSTLRDVGRVERSLTERVLASSQPALPLVANGTVVLNAGHGRLHGYPLH